MNLFVIAWNLPEEQSKAAVAQLQHMTDVFPQLDQSSLWHWRNKSEKSEHLIASMHTPSQVAAPRRYVWHDEKGITFYDGCMIAPEESFRANDAKALADNWDTLPEALEGWFTVAQVAYDPLSVTLLNDTNGIGPVYYLHRQGSWLLSNSVELIARIADIRRMDEQGISMFLTLGYVGAGRTLLKEVKLMPAGQIWKWRADAGMPDQIEYYPVTRLLHQSQKPPEAAGYQRLAEKLISACRRFSLEYGELICPLTGGRDTRFMASLLVAGGIAASYYTDGMPGSDDVEGAKMIAETLNVPHAVNIKTSEDVYANWDLLCTRLSRQTDGMVVLRQMADMLEPQDPDHLRIKLWGVGGLLARGKYIDPKLFYRRLNARKLAKDLIDGITSDHGGLIHSHAIESARKTVKAFLAPYASQCIAPLDILDVYILLRTRYLQGANYRKNIAVFDRFSPFFTRPFQEAVFAMPAAYRYSEPIHYHLIKMLAPNLFRLPIYPRAKGGWRSQVPWGNMLRSYSTLPLQNAVEKIQRRIFYRQVPPCFDHAGWLETKRHWFRQICLDQTDAPLWDVIDRRRFESITGDDTAHQKRRQQLQGIYLIATLFYYRSITT